jgi:hypothetical protein
MKKNMGSNSSLPKQLDANTNTKGKANEQWNQVKSKDAKKSGRFVDEKIVHTRS